MGKTTVAARPRPAAVRTTIGTLVFLGVTAFLGGVELTFGLWASAEPPADWLRALPLIDSWVLPGLVLGAGFGVGSLVAAYGMLRRPRPAWLAPVERLTGQHWSWATTELLGLGMVAWICLEIGYLPERSWLELLYGGVGLALVVLPVLPSLRRYLRRQRAHPPAA